MNQETENYVRHLRGQLNELRTLKSNADRIQEDISQLDNNFFVLRQERSENETHMEEGIKTNTRTLEEMKTENGRTLANIRDRQSQLDNLNQQLQVKNQKLASIVSQTNAQQWKNEANERLFNSLREQCSGVIVQREQLQAEHDALLDTINEVKQHISMTMGKVTNYRSRILQKEKNILLLEKRKEELMQSMETKRQELRVLGFKSDRNNIELQKSRDYLESLKKNIKQQKDSASQVQNENSELESKLDGEIKTGAQLESKLKRQNSDGQGSDSAMQCFEKRN